MAEEASHLALLIEADREFRLDPTSKAAGVAVLDRNAGQVEVRLYLRGLRPLRDPHDEYFYEAWLIDPTGQREPRPLGAFNADDAGSAHSFARLSGPEPEVGDPTAGGGAWHRMLLVAAKALTDPAAPGERRALLGLFGPAAPRPQIIDLQLQPIESRGSEAAVPPEQQAEAAEPVQAEPAGAPAEPADAAAEKGWAWGPVEHAPQSAPVGYRSVQQIHEALLPGHERISTATGDVQIDFQSGTCLATIRNLPPPAAWGMEATTGRPYNVYQAWVRNSRTDEWASLGFFRRIWSDTYRLYYRGAIPLHLYDEMIVSPEDRAGSADPAKRRLFTATYRSYEPVPRHSA